MKYGCIGEHLGHSFSQTIHEAIGEYEYELCEVPRSSLDEFMREHKFSGINVTIPYKKDVIPYLDFISEQARQIGAVNTVVNRGGKLYGYNTDFFGMRQLIARTGISVSGKSVLIAGTGGTACTARAVAESLAASRAVMLSRHPQKGDSLSYADAAEQFSDAALLINATPCGMFPDCDSSLPIPLENLPHLRGVADAVYNPLRTSLVLRAEGLGIPACAGLYMLVAQAVAAAGIFTDQEMPSDLTDRLYRRIAQSKENIVLIGMPGSGKTTVGKLLAERTGRELIDTDEVITRQTGKSIPDIFKREGEAFFRDLETETVKELSSRNGIIIATGGGTVLREENVRRLKYNGRLFFLDRSPEYLNPGLGRPLAPDTAGIERLYGQRIGIYRQSADYRITADGMNPAQTADAVYKEVENLGI